MAAEPNKNNPGAANSERAKMMRVLIPAGAIALVVVLVAVIASLTGSGGGKKMPFDGSDGTVDDPGLRELTSGIKIRDLKEGQGAECPQGATVRVNYTGWLKDGTEFDSSKKTGGPVEFSLDNVIAGWRFGIPGMKPGGVRKLVIEPGRGYGTQAKDKIPANSILIFEVELIEVIPKAPPKMPFDGSNGSVDDPGLRDIGEGLKIRDLKDGNGEPVPPGANVSVHYTGWTPDGHVFDSTKRSGSVYKCSLASGVIAGWQKGIPGMKPGGIRKLVIPPELGYGARGAGNDIPPNSVLIFEVELVK